MLKRNLVEKINEWAINWEIMSGNAGIFGSKKSRSLLKKKAETREKEKEECIQKLIATEPNAL